MGGEYFLLLNTLASLYKSTHKISQCSINKINIPSIIIRQTSGRPTPLNPPMNITPPYSMYNNTLLLRETW
jgi:hypothetical protein